MYYIVFYESWCSVVPKLWVDFKNKTFEWPPKHENIRTFILKHAQPNEKWSTLYYRRITGPYGNYTSMFILRYNLFLEYLN